MFGPAGGPFGRTLLYDPLPVWIGAVGRRTGWESDMSWTLLLVLITSWGVSMNADLRFATEDQCRAAALKIAQDIGAQGSQLRPHWSCVLQRRD